MIGQPLSLAIYNHFWFPVQLSRLLCNEGSQASLPLSSDRLCTPIGPVGALSSCRQAELGSMSGRALDSRGRMGSRGTKPGCWGLGLGLRNSGLSTWNFGSTLRWLLQMPMPEANPEEGQRGQESRA